MRKIVISKIVGLVLLGSIAQAGPRLLPVAEQDIVEKAAKQLAKYLAIRVLPVPQEHIPSYVQLAVQSADINLLEQLMRRKISLSEEDVGKLVTQSSAGMSLLLKAVKYSDTNTTQTIATAMRDSDNNELSEILHSNTFQAFVTETNKAKHAAELAKDLANVHSIYSDSSAATTAEDYFTIAAASLRASGDISTVLHLLDKIITTDSVFLVREENRIANLLEAIPKPRTNYSDELAVYGSNINMLVGRILTTLAQNGEYFEIEALANLFREGNSLEKYKHYISPSTMEEAVQNADFVNHTETLVALFAAGANIDIVRHLKNEAHNERYPPAFHNPY